jgi:hypothetical protein
MVESRHEWLNMVSGALLEGRDINVHPYIGLEIVRRKAERGKPIFSPLKPSPKSKRFL